MATAQLEGVDLRPRLDIDAEARLDEVGGETFYTMQKLAPFGRGNPNPTFISRGVEAVDYRTMGSNGEHLRLKVRQDGKTWDAVAFKSGSRLAELALTLDIIYNLEIDRWRGVDTLRLNILDFTPANKT